MAKMAPYIMRSSPTKKHFENKYKLLILMSIIVPHQSSYMVFEDLLGNR